MYDPDALDRRDPDLIARLLPALEAFHARYLRLRVGGTENIPCGSALFVANHNGGILEPDLFCTLGLAIVPRSGHDLSLEQPVATADLILEFLRSG